MPNDISSVSSAYKISIKSVPSSVPFCLRPWFLSYMSKNMLLSEKNGLNFNSMILTHCVMLDVEMLLNLLELEAMAECEDLHD